MPATFTPRPTGALVAAAAFLSSVVAASPAFAGACPAEHELSEPRTLVAPPGVGTARIVLDGVDLSGWRGVEGLALRMRKLIVAVGGFVPLHWHNDRPSIVYVVAGAIIAHSSFCAEPIVHVTGDWTPEFGAGHAHWWENKSGAEVLLISTDVVPTDKVDY